MGESILSLLHHSDMKNHGFSTWEETLFSSIPHQTDEESELEQLYFSMK